MKQITSLQNNQSLHVNIQNVEFVNDKLQPTIALLHSYDLIDDFLDSINISFETFCNEFIGSWTFGYIAALNQVNVRTVIFCISARFTEVSRFIHKPTGATICVLPPNRLYQIFRKVRRSSLSLYGADENQSFKDIEDENKFRHSLLTSIKDLAKSVGSYLSTPLYLLARELRRENCQAILCQEYEFARFDACVLLGRLINLPVFATFQGGDRTQSWLESPLRQIVFRGCTGVIIATQSEIERVCNRYQVSTTKVARIFNPLDVSSWQPMSRQQARAKLNIPPKAKVVVWHGRVEIERKGLDILLQAWQMLCTQRPTDDLRLLLIGTGSDAERFRQCLDRMQLRGISWVNEFVSDRALLQQYLSAANVYTLPSRLEGFPVAPLEAMACSLPVVAADAAGVADILEGGEISGGLIVPRENVHALAQALGRVLDSPDWGYELGKRGRYRVKEYFSLEEVGKQLRDFIHQRDLV